jgi:tetratricopeptide (TPR) repeat protein
MNLKENVSYIKDEISTEEQFFESFFRVESFYKKYKRILFLTIGLVFFGVIGMMISDYLGEKNTEVANEAYGKVLTNNDKESLAQLKSANETLYNVALFQVSKGQIAEVKGQYIEDLAQYNKAVATGNLIALDEMIMKQDFLLSDFAIISKSLILIDKKEYKKAKETIQKITPKSNVLPLANIIKHFLLTK